MLDVAGGKIDRFQDANKWRGRHGGFRKIEGQRWRPGKFSTCWLLVAGDASSGGLIRKNELQSHGTRYQTECRYNEEDGPFVEKRGHEDQAPGQQCYQQM